MKFKIGDKIKILPTAMKVNVPEDEVNKIGVITRYDLDGESITVLMDKERMENGCRVYWFVTHNQIELVTEVGKQLEFAFME